MINLDRHFPRYESYSPAVPVWCITPGIDGCVHRFFDTSPISPSGRWVALTRLPDESRLPAPDDSAEVVLVDLHNGAAEAVAVSRCFDAQLGAGVQWGVSDSELYFNDLSREGGKPRAHAVRLDPAAGTRTDLAGPVYMVSPDGSLSASPCLLRMPLTQPGYGAVVSASHLPYNRGADPDDGIFVTDNRTGESRLFISFAEIVAQIEPDLAAAFQRAGADLAERDLYGFHVKWNPSGDKLLFVVRARTRDPAVQLLNVVVTVDAATKRAWLSMPPDVWRRGGHHPNWHPDGVHVVMNLKYPDDELRFVRYRFDGEGLEVIADPVEGSGHPSFHPSGNWIVTDVYEHGRLAYPDGTTSIRFIDVSGRKAREIIRIRTRPDYHGPGRELRVDPHPAWDRSFTHIAFNACPDGVRKVFIADLSALVT